MRGIRKRIDQRRVVVGAGRRIVALQWCRCWSSVFVNLRTESNIPGQTSGSGILEVGRSADTSSVGTDHQYYDFVFGSSTHMELQPAEAAAWVTHWRTQAEIPLDSQRVRGSSARKNLRLGIDCGQGGSDCDDGCDSEFHCDGCGG